MGCSVAQERCEGFAAPHVITFIYDGQERDICVVEAFSPNVWMKEQSRVNRW